MVSKIFWLAFLLFPPSPLNNKTVITHTTLKSPFLRLKAQRVVPLIDHNGRFDGVLFEELPEPEGFFSSKYTRGHVTISGFDIGPEPCEVTLHHGKSYVEFNEESHFNNTENYNEEVYYTINTRFVGDSLLEVLRDAPADSDYCITIDEDNHFHTWKYGTIINDTDQPGLYREDPTL